MVGPSNTVYASEIPFSVETSSILRASVVDDVRFDFKTKGIKDFSNVSYFKMRTYCEDPSIRLNLVNFEGNRCGNAVRLDKASATSFSLILDNPTNNSVNFSFKLKAYDKNGKWIHTEKKSFNWN